MARFGLAALFIFLTASALIIAVVEQMPDGARSAFAVILFLAISLPVPTVALALASETSGAWLDIKGNKAFVICAVVWVLSLLAIALVLAAVWFRDAIR